MASATATPTKSDLAKKRTANAAARAKSASDCAFKEKGEPCGKKAAKLVRRQHGASHAYCAKHQKQVVGDNKVTADSCKKNCKHKEMYVISALPKS